MRRSNGLDLLTMDTDATDIENAMRRTDPVRVLALEASLSSWQWALLGEVSQRGNRLTIRAALVRAPRPFGMPAKDIIAEFNVLHKAGLVHQGCPEWGLDFYSLTPLGKLVYSFREMSEADCAAMRQRLSEKFERTHFEGDADFALLRQKRIEEFRKQERDQRPYSPYGA